MGRRNKGPKDVFELMQQREGYRITRGFESIDTDELPYEEDDELPLDLEFDIYETDPMFTPAELDAIKDTPTKELTTFLDEPVIPSKGEPPTPQ